MKTLNKKAAMEMSVGTIVTIVLLMSVLVLGLVLTTNIFKGATNAVDMTNDQLTDQISKLFSKDEKIVIYPESRLVQIKQEAIGAVGIGIKNKLTGTAGETKFSYTVSVSDPDLQKKCGADIRTSDVESWITAGREQINMPIASGDFANEKIRFEIPVGAPLCTIRFSANVLAGTQTYGSVRFDVQVLAK